MSGEKTHVEMLLVTDSWVNACVCVLYVKSKDGKDKNKILRVCGRKDGGICDVWMTSAAKGHCVKDTPASWLPPERVHVCVLPLHYQRGKTFRSNVMVQTHASVEM